MGSILSSQVANSGYSICKNFFQYVFSNLKFIAYTALNCNISKIKVSYFSPDARRYNFNDPVRRSGTAPFGQLIPVTND